MSEWFRAVEPVEHWLLIVLVAVAFGTGVTLERWSPEIAAALDRFRVRLERLGRW